MSVPFFKRELLRQAAAMIGRFVRETCTGRVSLFQPEEDEENEARRLH
jgi:hypothetical protein